MRLFFTLIMITSLSGFAERTLEINPIVKVSSKNVLLQDIIAEDSREYLTEAERLYVILSVKARGSRTYSRDALAYKMGRHKTLHDMLIKGPSRVTVSRIVNKTRIDMVKKELIAAILKDELWKDLTIDLEFNHDDERTISEYDTDTEVKVVTMVTDGFAERIKLKVQFIKDKIVKGTVTLKPSFKRQVNVIHFRNSLKRGTIVAQSDVLLIKAWVSGKEEGDPSKLDQVVGMEVERDKNSGSRIKFRDVRQPQCTKKGGIINIIAKYGNVIVRLKAKALKEGRRGDSITVLNISSQEIIEVTLIGKKLAEVK